jgi:hypothetical protein
VAVRRGHDLAALHLLQAVAHRGRRRQGLLRTPKSPPATHDPHPTPPTLTLPHPSPLTPHPSLRRSSSPRSTASAPKSTRTARPRAASTPARAP